MKKLLIATIVLLTGQIARPISIPLSRSVSIDITSDNVDYRNWKRTYGNNMTVYVTEYVCNGKLIGLRAFHDCSTIDIINSYYLLRFIETGKEYECSETAISAKLINELKLEERDSYGPDWWGYGYCDDFPGLLYKPSHISHITSPEKKILSKIIDEFLEKKQLFNKVESVPERSWSFLK